PTQQVHRGLAKLLEDRCEFAVAPGHAPDEVRGAVFRAATEQRRLLGEKVLADPAVPAGASAATPQAPAEPHPPLARGGEAPPGLVAPPPGHSSALPRFDRAAVLAQAARELGSDPAAVERALFADLRGEQQLVSFKDISARRLLQRYN